MPADYRTMIEEFLDSQGLVRGVGPGWYSYLWASDFIMLIDSENRRTLEQRQEELFAKTLLDPKLPRYSTREALTIAAWQDWKTRNEERDKDLEAYQESTTIFLEGCEALGISLHETLISQDPDVVRYSYEIGEDGSCNGNFASHGEAALAAVHELISEATSQRMIAIIAGIGKALGFDLWSAIETVEWRTTPIENLSFIITQIITEQLTENGNA